MLSVNPTSSNVSAVESVENPYRVMVVDDSAVIRGFLSRYLSEDPEIEVVTTANNGEVALKNLKSNDLEVVVLDIEMPVMDGMTALPKMIELQPDLRVVMASTLTLKNAEISLRALQMGAVDYVPKPETARSVNASIDFRRELVDKVKAWAKRSREKKNQPLPVVVSLKAKSNDLSFARPSTARSSEAGGTGFVTARRAEAPRVSVRGRASARVTEPAGAGAPTRITLRKGATLPPKILAIGSSTGGPQALMKFFAGFKQQPKVPVLITQHMPANFTAILANHLGQNTGWPSKEAEDGDILLPGQIYVAPGGKHMVIEKDGAMVKARLNEDPPENFCRPAVDPLFRSIKDVFGEKTLAVILTGMGHDGLKGARDLAQSGATILAQDEASSVVWGMPGAVATAGLCTEVLPIGELGQATAKRLLGGA